jgi:hypothetical protein
MTASTFPVGVDPWPEIIVPVSQRSISPYCAGTPPAIAEYIDGWSRNRCAEFRESDYMSSPPLTGITAPVM